jgi:hypothetical protein
VNWHGVPLLFLIVEFIFNSYRFIPKQFIAFVIVTLIYLLVCNMPYSLAVKPVYTNATTYKNWMTYVFILVAYIVGAITYFLARLIYNRYKEPVIEK